MLGVVVITTHTRKGMETIYLDEVMRVEGITTHTRKGMETSANSSASFLLSLQLTPARGWKRLV